MRAHLWDDADAMKAATAELASRAAVVKGSEKDLGALAGKRGMTWLEENAKGATWVLTRGENGAACVGPHGQVTFPTKRVRCIDATGAGDAFMAGLVAVLVRSGAKPGSADWKDPKLWSRAMEVGHQLGAKAISAVGAAAGMGQLDDLRARDGRAEEVHGPAHQGQGRFDRRAARKVTEIDWADGHKGVYPHDDPARLLSLRGLPGARGDDQVRRSRRRTSRWSSTRSIRSATTRCSSRGSTGTAAASTRTSTCARSVTATSAGRASPKEERGELPRS